MLTSNPAGAGRTPGVRMSRDPIGYGLTAALAAAVAAPISIAAPGTGFHVEPLAPAVYAVIGDDPLGLANHANSVFIVGEADVIVVDAQFTLERSREVLAAIRETTDKPVGVLINTHWHDDHTFGNQVYSDAYPEIEIVAHADTRTDMQTLGARNREMQVAGGPDAVAYFRNALATRTSADGSAMSDSEAVAYASTIAIVEEYLGDMDEFELTLPTRTFGDRLTLMQGERRIEVIHPGGAITRGDAIVYLPDEGVLAAGDLLANPLPFTYGADVDGWLAALDVILDLQPRIVVPGHGGVIRDLGQVRQFGKLLASIRQDVRDAATRGASPETIRATLDVGGYRAALAGDDRMLGYLFDKYFLPGVLNSAFAGTTESP